MKKISALSVVLLLAGMFYWIASYFAVSPEKREQEKMKFLKDRNALEKQVVGKWQPFLNTYNYPHQVFSADASYLYRKSSGEINTTGTWRASIHDSMLSIHTGTSKINYKILYLQTDVIELAQLHKDTLHNSFRLKKMN